MAVVPKGASHKEALEQQISTGGSAAAVWGIRGIARLTLESGKSELRANFITLDCNVESLEVNTAAWFAKVPKNTLLQALLKKSCLDYFFSRGEQPFYVAFVVGVRERAHLARQKEYAVIRHQREVVSSQCGPV